MCIALKKNVFLQIIIRTRTDGAGWDITRRKIYDFTQSNGL